MFAWLKSFLFSPLTLVPSLPVNNFDFAINYALQNEGGYSDHPRDSGGPTNYGITRSTLSNWRRYRVTADEVRELSLTEAEIIYLNWYWIDVGFDLIKSKAIATGLLDQAIVMGQRAAIMCAQLAANNCGAALVVDGVAGPLTLAALEKVDLAQFMRAFSLSVKAHYDAIIANKPNQKVFYVGWLHRASKLTQLVSVS